jgi:hypothetical protein
VAVLADCWWRSIVGLLSCGDLRLLLERDADYGALFRLYVNGEYHSYKSMKKSAISSSVEESLVY